MFLVLVDAHSKWIDVLPVQSATSILTIEKLRVVFAVHGLPEKIVADNGSVFTSAEFTEFVEKNGICHVRTSPYHPSSNGLAERAIQTFKHGVSRLKEGSWETKISRFLLKCWIIPHATTGRSPAELLLGRQPRSRLDLLHPDTNTVLESQSMQKYGHDKHARARGFQVGERVYLRNFTNLADRKSPRPDWASLIPSATTRWPNQEKTCGPSENPVPRGFTYSSGRDTCDSDLNTRIAVDHETDPRRSCNWSPDRPSSQPPESTVRRSSRVRNPPDRLC